MTWQDIIVDRAPREFIKEINNIENLARWTGQKRNKKIFKKQLEKPDEYAWKQFWTHLQTKGLHTSFKESKKRNFRIKMLHDELPTLEKLTERKPNLYNETNNKCRMCNLELETREHLFECKNLEQLTVQAWEATMKKTRKKIREVKGGNIEEEGTFRFQEEIIIDRLTKVIFKNKENRIKFALGMLRKDIIMDVSRVLEDKLKISKASLLLYKASEKFLESF